MHQFIKYVIVLVHYIFHNRPLYIIHAFIVSARVISIRFRPFFDFLDQLNFDFKHSTTIQVSGPTRCGKTRLVRRILEEQLIQPFATHIIWVFSEWQPNYDLIRERYTGIEFEKGWRDELFDSLSPEQRNILVLDDQMGVASSSTSVADVFTKGSHHRNLTVINLVQTVFNQGKSQKTI